jgi:hypothetical protein
VTNWRYCYGCCEGRELRTQNFEEPVEAVCFSPIAYWMCVATGPIVQACFVVLIYVLFLARLCFVKCLLIFLGGGGWGDEMLRCDSQIIFR